MKITNSLFLDKSSLVVISQRIFQSFLGFANILLLGNHLPSNSLGLYYTLINLLGIFLVADLGFNLSVKVFSAKKFSKSYEGTRDDFTQWMQSETVILAYNWAILWVIPVGIFIYTVGFFLFSNSDVNGDVAWVLVLPIIVMIGLVNFSLNAAISSVEGAGAIFQIYVSRIILYLLLTPMLMVMLYLEMGIWCAICLPICQFLTNVGLLYGLGFRSFFAISGGKILKAKNYFHPTRRFQYRMGTTEFGLYLQTQLIVPLLLFIGGSSVAGRLAILLTILNMVAMIAHAPLTRKFPQFIQARLLYPDANKNKGYLEHFLLTAFLYLLGVFGIHLMNGFGVLKFLGLPSYFSIEIFQCAGLILANTLVGFYLYYHRVHGREPFSEIILISGITQFLIGGYVGKMYGFDAFFLAQIGVILVTALVFHIYAKIRITNQND